MSHKVAVCSEKNRLRFVLKVMEPPYIARYATHLLARLIGHALMGRPRNAWIIAFALGSCMRELAEIREPDFARAESEHHIVRVLRERQRLYGAHRTSTFIAPARWA